MHLDPVDGDGVAFRLNTRGVGLLLLVLVLATDDASARGPTLWNNLLCADGGVTTVEPPPLLELMDGGIDG
uniref:Putative secreted protein n=1 Tax=Anopheles triannulatus TaxID=58253 RepID=A0A2M4B7V2_9DIPT